MRFLRKQEAAARVGYSQSHLMRLERAGKFPRRVHLGPNSVGFLEDEIDEWMQARVDDRDLTAGEAAQNAVRSADQPNKTAIEAGRTPPEPGDILGGGPRGAA